MSLLKRLALPSRAVLVGLLVAAGAASAVAGVYLLLGLGVALIVGGVAAVAFGLLVDV